MLSIIFKTSCGLKTKCWNNWEHVAFSRMWLSMPWRLFSEARISWTKHLATVWGVGIDMLDFVDIPMHLIFLGIKKYIISIPTLLKQRLRHNQNFGRLTSKSLKKCRENALEWCNASKVTSKHGWVSTKGWESSHYQAFRRASLSIYSHFDSTLNEDQLKCNSSLILHD